VPPADLSAEPVKPTLSILIRVRGALPNLRPAERRVADMVLADPAGTSESSITALARQCQTSETTVLRFCRAIGLAGYPDLRIALARAAQWEESDHVGPPITGLITETDSLAEVVAKVTHADARAIEDTGAALDLEVLEAAVAAVSAARRVDVYGTGASALVGQDLQLKLHRIGHVAHQWSQFHQALASAALLGAADVAIAISHTGATSDTVESLRTARQAGATTVGITNFSRSPISEHADLLLLTAARETTFRSGAMSSRIAQLAVVDYLFTGVAQRSFARSVAALEATFVAVQTARAPGAGRSRGPAR
jgi:DNA-binding MurR/RpiR family transcriptional regulator